MAKMNWSKAKKLKDVVNDGFIPRTRSNKSISKRQRKALARIRAKGIYNFSKFGPTNSNPALRVKEEQPKAHDELGTGPIESQLDMGATQGDKDWDSGTRIEDKLHETDLFNMSLDVKTKITQ